MSIRRPNQNGMSSSKARAKTSRLREKALRLRDRIKASSQRFLARFESRRAWWQHAFRTPLVGFYGWVFSQASSLWAAYMTLLGLSKSPRTSLAGRHGQLKRASVAKRSGQRGLQLEGLEQRQLLAADLQLDVLASAAQQHWVESGISQEQQAVLASVSYSVEDLGPGNLGKASGTTITIDDNAAGRGWFVDSTPLNNEEFGSTAYSANLSALPNSQASNKVDLLSVLIHEQGHVLGLGDASGAGGVMDEGFTAGERRLPRSGEASAADPSNLDGVHFTHFRHGSLTWELESSDPTNRTVEFNIEQSYRRSYYGSPNVGDVVSTETFSFGDATSQSIPLLITSIDTTNDIMFGVASFTHTYPADGNYTAGWNSVARVSTLKFFQNDDPYTVLATVNISQATPNEPPLSSIAPIVQVQDNTIATFQIPAFDPEGQPLTYSISTTSGLSPLAPPGLTVSSSGLVTWDILDLTAPSVVPGNLGAVQVNITDGVNTIPVDFILQVANTTNVPPTLVANPAGPFSVNVGQPLTFDVTANDSDGKIASNQALNAPVGMTLSAFTAGAASSTRTVNWTPAAPGNFIVGFQAVDDQGGSVFTPVVINVVNTAVSVQSTILTPTTGAVHNDVNWPDVIDGTADGMDDAVVGVNVRVKDSAGNFWQGPGLGFAPAVHDQAAAVTATSATTATWTLPFLETEFPFDDTYTIEARATDLAGNTESTSTATIAFDTTAPWVAFTGPAATFDHTPTLTGTFADPDDPAGPAGNASGVVAVTASITGLVNVGPLPASLSPAGQWEVTVPPASNLPDGTYTLHLMATDAASNTSTVTTATFDVFTLSVKVEATDTNGEEDAPNPPTQTNGQWTVSLVASSGGVSMPIPAGTFPLANDVTVLYTLSNGSIFNEAKWGDLASGGDFTVALGTGGATISGLPPVGTLANLPLTGPGSTLTLLKSGVPTLVNMYVSDDLVLDPGESVVLTIGGSTDPLVDIPASAMDSAQIDIIDNEAVTGIAVSLTATDSEAAETTMPFDIQSVFNADVIYNNGDSVTPDPTQSALQTSVPNALFATSSVVAGGLPNTGNFSANNPAIQLNYNNNNNGNNAYVVTGTSAASVVLPHVAGKYSSIDIVGAAADTDLINGKTAVSVTVEYGGPGQSFTTPTISFLDWRAGGVPVDSTLPTPLPVGYFVGSPAGYTPVDTNGTLGATGVKLSGASFDLATGNPLHGGVITKVTVNVHNVHPSASANAKFALLGAFGTQSVGNTAEFEVKLTSGGAAATAGADVDVKVNIGGTASYNVSPVPDYTFSGIYSGPTSGGSNPDYVIVRVPAGQSSVKFKITTGDDAILEPTENVVLTIHSVSSTAAVQPFLTKVVTPATATIEDNDFGLLEITTAAAAGGDSSAAEPGGAANDGKVVVTLSRDQTTYTGPISSSTDTYVPVTQGGSATTAAQVVGATTTNPDYQTGIDEQATAHNSTATAQRIDGYWNTNANPYIQSAAVPHNIVFGSGDNVNRDVYSVMMLAGQTATFDIDFTTNGFDSYLDIFAPNGTLIAGANNNDSASDPGSPSSGNKDSLLTYTATTSGLHYIRVSQYSLSGTTVVPLAIPSGVTYQLNVSVTGHTTGALIPAGETDTAWRVKVMNDTPKLIEPSETATFKLGTPVVGDPQITSAGNTATVNILDDDLNNKVVIEALASEATGRENPQINPSFTISIKDANGTGAAVASDTATVVKFKVNGLALGAEFGGGNDYTFQLGGPGSIAYNPGPGTSGGLGPNEGSITIPAGTKSVKLTVIVNNDNIIEDDEAIEVELKTPKVSGDADITVDANMKAQVTIISDDDASTVTLNGGLPAIEGVQDGVLVVGLTGGKVSDTDTTVRVKITNVSASSADYTLVEDPSNTGTLVAVPSTTDQYYVTIKKGTSSTTVFYSTGGIDLLVEPDETFNAEIVPYSGSVNVSGDTDIQISASNKTATGTIVDNTAVFVKISKAPNSTAHSPDITEGGSGAFAVELFSNVGLTTPFPAADVQTPVTGTFTVGGSATPGPVTQSSRDYTTISPLTFTIPSGSSSTSIAVNTNDDLIADAGETVIATLTSATVGGSGNAGRVQLSSMATDTIVIVDNDSVTATLSSGDATMQERNNNGKVSVTLSGAVSTQVTVELMITHSSTATGNGSGVAGDDFKISSYFVTFQPFETVKTVDLTVIDDTDLERKDEYVDVAIKNIFAIDPQVTVPAPTFTIPGAPGVTPIRWNSVDGGNDHWYVLAPSSLTFSQHSTNAGNSTFTASGLANASAHLATLTSSAENQFVINSVLGGASAYLGAFNSPAPLPAGIPGPGTVGGGPGGLHRWVTGENWLFGTTGGVAPWASGTPNNIGGAENVVEIDGTGIPAVWNDIAGTNSRAAIYEFSAPNNGALPLGSAVRVTIKADPQVEVVTHDPTAAETAGALPLDQGVFRIQLRQDEVGFTNTVQNNLTVQYILRGEAVEGSDYAALGLGTVRTAIIPAGGSFVDVDITAINDDLIENDENVWIQVVGVSGTGVDADITVGSNLYSMGADGQLRQINPENGSMIGNPITISGPTITSGQGLAVNPLTGEMFGLVSNGATSTLIKFVSIVPDSAFGPGSASATSVGATGQPGLTDIAFGNDGTLYGVIAGSGSSADRIYIINVGTGAATLFNSLTTVSGPGEAIALGDPAANGPLFRIAGNPAEQFRTYNPLTNANGAATGMTTANSQGQASALTYNYADGNFFFADSTENNDGLTGPTVNTEFFSLTGTGAVSLLGNMNHVAEGLAYFHPTVEIKDNDSGILKIATTDAQGDDGYGAVATDNAAFEISLVDPVSGTLVKADSDTKVTFSALGTATPYLGDQVEATDSTSTAVKNLDSRSYWSQLTNSKIVNSTTIPHTTVYGTGAASSETDDWYSFTVLNNGDRVIIDIDGTNGWDSYIELRDSTGAPLAPAIVNNDGGGDAADGAATDSQIDTTALNAGTYRIRVSRGPTAGGNIAAGKNYTLNLSVQNHLIADYQLTSNAANNLNYDATSGLWNAIVPTGGSTIPLTVNVFNDTQVEGNESVKINMVGTMGDADIHLGGSARSIAPYGTDLQIISTGTGQVISSVPIALSPGAYGHALAKHPTTGVLYAAIQLPPGFGASDGLYTVDATTGVATLVGGLGDNFDALAFDNAGNLLGITDFFGSLPNSLFRINTTDASKVVVGAVAPFNYVSHGLALNSDNGLLYHVWGGTSANSNLFLQTINPTNGSLVTISLTGASALSGNPASLGYEGNGIFKLIDEFGGLWSITLGAGSATLAPVTVGAAGSEGMVILQTMMTSASATIRDHDQAELYVVRTDNGMEAAPVDNGSITFGLRDPATLTPVTSDSPVLFDYSIGGSATNGSDYQMLSGSATIGAGQSELTVDVLVNNDSIAEGPEQADFAILTTGPTLPTRVAFAAPASRTGTVTIAELDSTVVEVNSNADSHAAEAGSDPARFTFTMSGAGAGVPVTVNFMVDSTTTLPRASAVPTLVNPVADYTLSSALPVGLTNFTFDATTGLGSFVFPVGFTAVNIVVTPNNDAITEGTETLGLKIVSVNPGPAPVTVGSANSASVTIDDNDASVISIVRVSDASEDPAATPALDGVTGQFRVSLSNPVENPVTVEIKFDDPASTADIGLPGFGPGTADFWSPQITSFGTQSGTITFNPGVTSQFIDIIPLEQGLLTEGDETVTFDLTNIIASTGNVSIASAPSDTATLLILDEFFDVTLEVDDSFASENGSLPTDAGSFNVRISSPSAVDTIVTYVIEKTNALDPLTHPFARVGQPTINEVEPNQQAAAPFYASNQNLDIDATGELFGWSLQSNPQVLDSGVTGLPYVRVNATGDGTFDYYSFKAADGARVVIDVDNSNISTDTHVFLLNAAGQVIASNDNAAAVDSGSSTLNDSFIDRVINVSTDGLGPYIIAVGETGSFIAGPSGLGIAGNPLDVGDAYTLNVSVAGHLTADYATPSGVTGPAFNTGQVTIPAGALFVPVTINPVDDKLVEGDETFRVSLTSITSSNGLTNFGGTVSGEITIQDDDAAVVSATGPSSAAVEPASPAVPQNVDITIPIPSSAPVKVRFTVTGSATNPIDSLSTTDYELSGATLAVDGSTTGATEKNDFTIIIPAGQTKATVTITPKADNLLEQQETVIITPTAIVSGSQGGLITASNIGITTLIDDSDVARVINTNLGADLSGTEPGGALPADISFLVKLDPAAPSYAGVTADGDITVNWSISSGSAIAAPAANADYQVMAVPGEVTVNANGTSGTVTIKKGTTGTFIPVLVLDDSIVEGLENLTLTIANPVNSGGRNVTLGTTVSQTATIDDDNDAAIVKIVGSPVNATETGTVSTKFTVSQSAVSSTPTKVRIQLIGGTAVFNNSSNPSNADYSVTTNANVVAVAPTTSTNPFFDVTIPAGSLSTDVEIKPINDNTVEAFLETVIAKIDSIPSGDLQITPSPVATDLTATVNIEDNDVAKFSISTTNPNGFAEDTSNSTVDGSATFVVNLDRPLDVPVTLVISFTDGTASKVAGVKFVTDPQDYDGSVQYVTYTVGQSGNKTVTVPLKADTMTEDNETFDANISVDGASLSALVGRQVDLTADTATAKIIDNDKSKISVVDQTVIEGGNVAFTVSLDKPVDKDLTISVALQDGTGPSGAFGTDLNIVGPIPFGADYDSNDIGTATVTFLAGSTTASGSLPVVKTNPDQLVEGGPTGNFGSETFVAVPSIIDAIGARNITLQNGTATITDNDSAVVTISSTDVLASEPGKVPSFGNANFVVKLSHPSSTATVIPFTMSGDAKTGTQNPGSYTPDDYDLVLAPGTPTGVLLSFNAATGTGTITIPASGTSLTGPDVSSATILLVPRDDDATVGAGDGLVEDDETAIMTLAAPSSGDPNVTLGAPHSQTVTIVDDDDATVSISATQPFAIEGGTAATVTVTLSNPADEPIDVQIGRAGGTSSPSDYSPLTFPTVVTIPAGALSTTLLVTAFDDNLLEGDETLDLVIDSVSNNADVSIGAPNTAQVVLRDAGNGLFISIDVAASDLIAKEEGQDVGYFVIQLTDGAGQRVTVPSGSSVYVVYDIVTGSTAIGADYVGSVSNNVTITAGASQAIVQITPFDDAIPEVTEIVNLQLQSGLATPGGLGPIALGTFASPALTVNSQMQILDNDAQAPNVESVQVNDGSAQRSQVKSLTVTFDSIVNHDDTAIKVEKRSDTVTDAVVGSIDSTSGLHIAWSDSATKTTAVLTFNESSVYVTESVRGTLGSLVDGNYQVKVDATKIKSVYLVPLASNTLTGQEFVWGNNKSDDFFRLFGDSTGAEPTHDSYVDGLDLAVFLPSLFMQESVDAAYDSRFDNNDDGFVDGLDLADYLTNLFASGRLGGGF